MTQRGHTALFDANTATNTNFTSSLRSHQSSVDGKTRTGDKRCGVAGEENCRRRALFKLAEAIHWNSAFYYVIHEVGVHFVGHLRWEESRGKRIDSNAFSTAPLLCQITRQRNNGGFARGIRRLRQA